MKLVVGECYMFKDEYVISFRTILSIEANVIAYSYREIGAAGYRVSGDAVGNSNNFRHMIKANRFFKRLYQIPD